MQHAEAGFNDKLLSIVIPTRHRNEILSKCLERLSPDKQGVSEILYEIIVSDDGINSTARQLINEVFPWVKWVEGPRKGPAANRNNGVRYSEGKWILFTDDDCLPGPNWIASYMNAFISHPEHNVFEGRTIADREKQRFNEASPINITGGNLWSCNLAVKRDYYIRMGGFSEDFSFEMEDIEFRTRVLKDNQRLLFVPEAEVCHPWRPIDNNYKVSIESVVIYLDKHPDHIKYYLLLPRLKIITLMILGIFKNSLRFRFRGIVYAVKDVLYEIKSAFYIHFKVVVLSRKNMVTSGK